MYKKSFFYYGHHHHVEQKEKLTEDVNAYWFPHRVASDSIVSTVNNINQHDRADEDDACHDDADDDLDAGHDDDDYGGFFLLSWQWSSNLHM